MNLHSTVLCQQNEEGNLGIYYTFTLEIIEEYFYEIIFKYLTKFKIKYVGIDYYR